MAGSPMSTTSRERVNTSLAHVQPDRTPVDFLATPEIWRKLADHYQLGNYPDDDQNYFCPVRRQILTQLNADCAVLSYDMFYKPPQDVIGENGKVDWWTSLARSTPARMWRNLTSDGIVKDLWGHEMRLVNSASGKYEEFSRYPLADAQSPQDVRNYAWPKPEHWDFSDLDQVVSDLKKDNDYHIRFRAGSIFEYAWQLRGMEQFMVDLAANPEIPTAIMSSITGILCEVLEKVLKDHGNLIDLVYFYDDVGSQENLMISKRMWQRLIRPHHEKLIAVVRKYGKKVMYHTDGAIRPIIPDLIDMGIDVLNPIQPTAKNLEPKTLKEEFGDKLAFHGGIDIVETLPKGTPEKVREEVKQRIFEMSVNGGYIMCSSHHIQSDTPLENVLAMYELDLRN